MLQRKIPVYYVLIFSVFSLFLGFVLFRFYTSTNENTASISEFSSNTTCEINAKRLKGFDFIMPLVYAEPSCESKFLNNRKSEIQSLIDGFKAKGDIKTASVYIRTFKDPQWISINENEIYSPGSLLKVPELIAFYKMEEIRPGTLAKRLTYTKPFVTHRTINFDSKHIQVGQSYTIKELLNYMIVHSDNEATMMLNQVIDRDVFNKVFSDIGLKEPDFNSRDYPMTAPDYSVFMKELFNGSYLNFSHSEECMKLLSISDFNEGMIAGLPAGIVACHKFGEAGPDYEPNFSESAVIYLDKKPYLLTIMTKGKDIKKLPMVTRDISKKIYEMMVSLG